MPIKRVLLPDTLGVLNPNDTYNYLNEIVLKYPNIHFDFHAHNDYEHEPVTGGILEPRSIHATASASIRSVKLFADSSSTGA